MTITPFRFLDEQEYEPEEKEESSVSRPRSLIGAPIKGALKGVIDLARMSPAGFSIPSEEALEKQVFSKILPTQKHFSEKALERGGKILPALAGGGEGLIGKAVRSGVAGLSGQIAEELGAPKWLQSLIEAPATFFPSMAKNIPLKEAQKPIVDFAKKQGITESQIAPLLNTPESLERWASMAKKGRKTHELMSNLYSQTSGIYKQIRDKGSKLSPMNKEQSNNLLDDLQHVWEEVTPDQRKLIEPNIGDLFKSKMGWNDVHNFLLDINAKLSAVPGGKNVIGLFKSPAYKALQSMEPELFKDLRLADELYATRANVAAYLKPKQIDALVDAGEVYAVTTAIAQRDLGLMGKVVGAVGGRALAREMLINPRLQNMSNRMLESLQNNSPQVALRYFDKFKEELKKSNEELAEQLPERKQAKSKIKPLPFE